MQLKRRSLVEAITNTATGFAINYFAGLIILPAFGCDVGPVDVGWITAIYTVISVVRNYFVRRLFV